MPAGETAMSASLHPIGGDWREHLDEPQGDAVSKIAMTKTVLCAECSRDSYLTAEKMQLRPVRGESQNRCGLRGLRTVLPALYVLRNLRGRGEGFSAPGVTPPMTQPAPRLASVPRAPAPSGPRLRVRTPPSRQNVLDQVRFALRPKARLGFVVGLLLGGIAPLLTFWEAHHEVSLATELFLQPGFFIALGGLVFSAFTVFQWARQAFHHPLKAAGFVVLLEGVMITCHAQWVALVVLGYLVAINGVATACNLAGDS